MCGFGVELRLDGSAPQLEHLQAMAHAMRHRGPDDEGYVCWGPVGLAHRRLAVIDVSDRSAQPMVESEHGLSLVYNGALYNYRALRETLRQLGYTFRTDGDTEVILHAYRAWGARCVDHMQGMFAFVIHERASGKLFAARDRLGIKPLYYARVCGAIRLSSTTQGLLAAGLVDTALDPIALHHYMTLHAIVPAPRTILRGIRKIPPAHTMTVEPDGALHFHEYWRPSFTPDESLTLPEAVERVEAALQVAVARRTVADVPVGVLLSGGLDSSLLVALYTQEHGRPPPTFSVGFESSGPMPGDEFHYSTIVAQRYGTEHRAFRYSAEQVVDGLSACIDAMSEPMVSHDNIGFFLLGSQVRNHVKVVQTGQGADELFAGYHWYPPMMGSVDPLGDYADVFFDRDHAEVLEAMDPRLHGPDASRQMVANHFARPGAPGAIDKALRIDATVMLCDDPVKRVDNMTMAWGVESRLPFLDQELVELAGTIPARFKVGSGGKHVLKEAARRWLPAQIVDRPKGYFPVPALTHLEGPVLERVRNAVTDPSAGARRLFRPAYVQRLLDAPHAHVTPMRASKLWQIGVLHMWLTARGL